MKRKIIIVFSFVSLALAIGLAWYNHQYYCYFYPFITMPSGLSYKAIGMGNGRRVQDGEVIQLSLVMKVVNKKGGSSGKDAEDNQDRILVNTSDQPQPFLVPFDDSLKKEGRLAEMIGMVEERQRMVFKFSPQYYLGEENAAHLEKTLKALHLKEDDKLVMDIKLDKIMTKTEAIEMIEARCAAQLEKDKQRITDYLAAHDIQACSTDSGLFYIIDQPSQDIPVVKNKTVKVNYTGKLLDGTIFDTNVQEVAKANNMYYPQKDYKPLEFQVGTGCVIAGFEEGVLLLKKNEKARFFIPSNIAYGEKAMGESIVANSVLIFEIEVIDVF